MAATKLNLIPVGVMPVVYVNQYDFGITQDFEIYFGDTAYLIPTGYSVTLRATKPDGYGITVGGIYTAGQNVVRVTIPQQLTAAAGNVIAELVFLNSSTVRAGTINIVIHVEPAALSDDTIISDSDISYIEEAVDRIGNVDVIKAQSLENARDLADTGYYKDLIVTTGTYTNVNGENTEYYIVTVPPVDSDGSPIPIEANLDPGTTPLTHAQKEHTTLTTNSSLDLNHYTVAPAVIHNGEIIRESTFGPVISQYPYVVYVGFDEQRRPHEYPITTSASDMVADGIKEASVAYYRLVIDGVARDVSDIGLSPSNLRVNPRMALFTKSDGSICFLACDGRDGSNEGLTPSELASLMITSGAVQGWNLDGGGSTSLVLNGSKLNRNIDDNGMTDRHVIVTWNVPFKVSNHAIQDVFSQIGVEKQRLIQQIVPEMFTNNTLVVNGKALLSLTDGNYYAQNCTDAPTVMDDGYAVVFEKYNSVGTYKKILWYPYGANTVWMNSYNGTEWIGWSALDVVYSLLRTGTRIPANSDLDDYINPGTFYIATAADAATIANNPATTVGLKLTVEYLNNTNIIQQTAMNVHGNEFIRMQQSGTWGIWLNKAICKGTSVTIPASGKLRISGLNYNRGMILVSGPGANAYGSCMFVKSGTAAVHIMNVETGSLTSIATAGNNQYIEITNLDTSNTQGAIISLFGSVRQVFDIKCELV